MAAAIGLRADFNGAGLRRRAKTTKDGPQARRLLALAEIYDGGSRHDSTRIDLRNLSSEPFSKRHENRLDSLTRPPFGCNPVTSDG